MKKGITFLSIAAIISFELMAQYSIDWIMPGGNYNKTAVMSVIDGDDNLIVTGYLQSENIYTRKYDIAGILLWEVSDGSGMAGKYQKPLWISRDADDNVFVVGKRYSISSVWEYPDAVIALKYTPEGTLLWKQLIPVTVLVGSQHPAFNVRSEADGLGNLYIGTVAADPNGFILTKIDPEGNVVFSNTSNVNGPTGFSSMRLRDGMIVLSGAGAIVAPVTAFDTGGEVLWTASPLGRGARDIGIGEQGNVYMITSFSNQVSTSSGEDMIVYKFSADGIQLWKKDFDLGGYEYPSKCALSPGRLSITGYGATPSSAYFDWKTLQLDTEGSLIWSATYNGTMYNDELPHFLASTPEGEVIVTGVGGPSPSPGNLSWVQMVILQYSNTGDAVWTDTPDQYGGPGLFCMPASDGSLYATSHANMTAYHYHPDAATGVNDMSRGHEISIGPNPFNDEVTVYLKESDPTSWATIYNSQGGIIRSIQLYGDKSRIDCSSLVPGIYICHISSGQAHQSFKIVKR